MISGIDGTDKMDVFQQYAYVNMKRAGVLKLDFNTPAR